MKLRIRSLESKETQRIQVPNSCILQQLKGIILRELPPSSSSSTENLRLSLNRKDELFESAPEESLQSLGVTSGDLIYFSYVPFAFCSEPSDLSGCSCQNDESMKTQMLKCPNLGELIVASSQTRESIDAQMVEPSKLCNPNDKTGDMGNFEKEKPMDTNTQVGISVDGPEGAEEMDVDDDDESVVNLSGEFSVPSFLKVFLNEVGSAANGGGDHELLMMAVHAVLLESGFIGYDRVSGSKKVGFYLPGERPSSASCASLHYTLPEVTSSEMVETVTLKFQTLGKFVNIYGCLPKKGFGVHRVCLEESRFVRALRSVMKDDGYTDSEVYRDDVSMKLNPNQEIFELWRIVKDGLSYPLLIDLCEKVGLVPPPCFMRLPTELKLKVLEALPATSVARVACVCSELRFVASNNDLWKLKYEQEFGNPADSLRQCEWKAKFCIAWEQRKKRRTVHMPYPWREPTPFRPLFPGRRDPNFLGSPFTIGGDFDRLPALGAPHHHGQRFLRGYSYLGRYAP